MKFIKYNVIRVTKILKKKKTNKANEQSLWFHLNDNFRTNFRQIKTKKKKKLYLKKTPLNWLQNDAYPILTSLQHKIKKKRNIDAIQVHKH